MSAFWGVYNRLKWHGVAYSRTPGSDESQEVGKIQTKNNVGQHKPKTEGYTFT